MRCCRKLIGISCRDNITTEEMKKENLAKMVSARLSIRNNISDWTSVINGGSWCKLITQNAGMLMMIMMMQFARRWLLACW